jgi:hypothetical protein
MTKNNLFAQARLKLRWADIHIEQIQLHLAAYLKEDFCEIRVDDDPGGDQILRVVSIKAIPAHIAFHVGDAVHNMRCALDYAVSELLWQKDTRTTFPMGERREELIDAFRTEQPVRCGKTMRKGRCAAIEAAIPGMGAFVIDHIRPYKGGHSLLWSLGKLDARDKHRLLLPVVEVQQIRDVNVVDNSNLRGSFTVNMVGSAGIANVLVTDAGGLKIESYGKPTAEVFLDEVGVVEHQALVPTLLQMSQAVSETLDSVGEFALSAGWKTPTDLAFATTGDYSLAGHGAGSAGVATGPSKRP